MGNWRLKEAVAWGEQMEAGQTRISEKVAKGHFLLFLLLGSCH